MSGARDLASGLGRLAWARTGTVDRSMRLERLLRPCFYMETDDDWSTPWWEGCWSWPYEVRADGPHAPPIGVRSAVPLGGVGAGTLELRADGSLRDWSIFGNASGSLPKTHVEEAFFALRLAHATGPGTPAVALALRTHPPQRLPGVARIEYAGSWPAAHLAFVDPRLPVRVELVALSPFAYGDPEESGIPAVTFVFVLENLGPEALEAGLMFVLPNVIRGGYRQSEGILLVRPGEEPLSGSLAVRVDGDGCTTTAIASSGLSLPWELFAATGKLAGQSDRPWWDGADIERRYGAACASLALAPGVRRLAAFTIGWHFPHRRHAGHVVGMHYARRHRDAADAARAAHARLAATVEEAAGWHAACHGSGLPDWLADALVNSAATIAKTGFRTGDGRFRQWESFSCPAIEPVHIHLYRSLPLAWLFPGFRRGLLDAYAAAARPDGYIMEDLGRADTPVDHPTGRVMGDTCTGFLLSLCQEHLWGAARTRTELWPAARAAARWQIARAEPHGLPRNLDSTYDWWKFAEKDVVACNAFLHLAALRAAERMAAAEGDDGLAHDCRAGFERGRDAVSELLWTGTHFRAWWMADGSHPPDAIHADTLYGQLWAFVLGLGALVEPDRLRSHLAAERRRCSTPWGLAVMRGAGRDGDGEARAWDPADRPRDDLVWQVGSLDWCSLGLYLGLDPAECLAEARKVVDNWRVNLADFWDWRDLTTAWNGEPWCNSHYSRQLILWTIPLALSGQQYDAAAGSLSFSPRVALPLPFMLPGALGVVAEGRDGRPDARVLCGSRALPARITMRAEGAA